MKLFKCLFSVLMPIALIVACKTKSSRLSTTEGIRGDTPSFVFEDVVAIGKSIDDAVAAETDRKMRLCVAYKRNDQHIVGMFLTDVHQDCAKKGSLGQGDFPLEKVSFLYPKYLKSVQATADYFDLYLDESLSQGPVGQIERHASGPAIFSLCSNSPNAQYDNTCCLQVSNSGAAPKITMGACQ